MDELVCACGCGCTLVSTDARGRARKYIHGHNGRLQVKKPYSSQEAQARVIQWRKDNPVKYKALARRGWLKRYKNHRDEELARSKEFQKRTRPARTRTNVAYMKAHPEKVSEWQHRTRAKRLSRPGDHTSEQWIARVTFWGWKCRYCGVELDAKTLTKDHMIPLARGGSNWASNLVPACLDCNKAKWCHDFKSFIQRRVL